MMKLKLLMLLAPVSAVLLADCDPDCVERLSPRTNPLDEKAWSESFWISVKDAHVATGKIVPGNLRAADGTSWFATKTVNAKDVKSAKWMVAGLGTFDIYVNGKRVGMDFLKPGFTHNAKTKYAFTYDVTKLLNTGKGEENALAAEVSAGWWRDKIVTPTGSDGFVGKKSAFRGVLELTYCDGSRQLIGSRPDGWTCGVAGPVTHAAIFDGEEYDARRAAPCFGEGLTARPERNDEFVGRVFPSDGAEICLRRDLAMAPKEAYCWKGVRDANGAKGGEQVFGKVVRTRTFEPDGTLEIPAGETLIVDFGQNCSAVPFFRFSAAAGTVLTVLPGEMLNEANGERRRGNDGPAGSIYRENLRSPEIGMRFIYTFAGAGVETYLPRFSFCGYRYVSVTATADVTIERLRSVPVTSIWKGMELGRITTGDRDVNRLISNIYWGQLSNYLSVPTDCPQRNERLGWAADTQIFAEAGSFNADTSGFFRKWMRDMRDSQDARGSFPCVAPFAQYGYEPMRIGWADAGVIVPYRIWKQFGDTKIVEENWAAMEKYVGHVAETRYEHEAVAAECKNFQFADWLSFDKLESAGGSGKPQNSAFEPNPNGKGRRLKADALVYWDYLGGCYWTWDAQMMAQMAKAIGKDAAKYEKMAAEAKTYMKKRFIVSPDGLLLSVLRDIQTAALFALKLDLVEGAAKEATVKGLRANFKANNDCLKTGLLGTSILMDTLSENGMADVAYTLLLNHNFPGWLYSVDQGATTIWERWNSYVKATGFGPVAMNSFNHYAYGVVLAWLYKTAAGIAADPAKPGFANIVMKPVPDRRLGSVSAEYRTPYGLVKSAWKYAGGKWIWDFEIPAGATASVTLPGETAAKTYVAGTYHVATTATEPLTIVRPRCEHLREAIGLANPVPRFTWGLAGGEADGKVRAEIRVGECPDALAQDKQIVWRHADVNLFERTYAGPALSPEKPYFWQVRLIDDKGVGVTPWTAPEKFIIALQNEAAWAGAKWICENRDYRPLFGDGSLKFSFKVLKGKFDAHVRCTADGKGGTQFTFGDGLSDGKNHEAELVCRGGRVEAKLDGVSVAVREGVYLAGSFGVTAHAGADVRLRRIAWVGMDGREEIYDDFNGHRQAAFFHTERDNDGLVLGHHNKRHFHPGLPSKYCPRLRKTFKTEKKQVLWATASTSGRGFYELWLNGRKVDPKRVISSTPSEKCGRPFETYDVTSLVRPGDANTIGVWLAPGYSDDFSRYGSCWLKSKRARVKLTVAYADGTLETVVSDNTWESTDRSPITYASIYHGEIYDASLEDPAWCEPAAGKGSAAVWRPALLCTDEQQTKMCPSEAPPVRMLEPLRPVRITEPQRGVFVVDFGQNRGGFVEVRAKGPRGTAIRLRTSEILGANGMIDPWTNRRAISADTFVLAGTGKVETYVPRFTYHGFHYVEITGWPGTPTADDLTAWAVHADLERTASFDCSDKDLMKVHNAATWSMLSNLVGFPTDCCMRDERTACSMDSQGYEDTSCQFFDMERYYTKWCNESGVGGPNPDWSGDGQTLPMRLWKYYGNRRELESRYEGIKQAVANVYARYPDGYCKDGFGDWCAPNSGDWREYYNDVELVNTAIFATMIENVVTAAKALGKDADAAAYAEKYARERQVFESRFRNAGTPTYGDRSQTTFVLPLAFGLVPEADRAAVFAELVKTIRVKDKGRFGTGLFGTRYIGDVLLGGGEADLFRDLFTQKERPGFGYMFENGGTTLWEQWTFKGGMNSHNHAMWSGAASCFFTHLAGIRPSKPGYAEVLVKPTFPSKLNHLTATRFTPHGEIKVVWKRVNGKIVLDVTVPPYVPATLELPDRTPTPLYAGLNRFTF